MNGPLPAAMARALARLKSAVDALPPHDASQSLPVACPIFGSTTQQAAPSITGLAPQLAQASAELHRALTQPPQLAGQWPFADPAGLVASRAARNAAGRGRKSAVKPNQVVRLVRFVKLGDSQRTAAEKAGLPRTTAQRILSGQHEVAHHPAVVAAGVYLPTMQTPPSGPNVAHKSRKAPTGADQTQGAGVVATRPLNAPKAAIPKTGFEAALTAAESEAA